MAPGTYSDSVDVAVCTDSTCTQTQSGTDVIVPVNYTSRSMLLPVSLRTRRRLAPDSP